MSRCCIAATFGIAIGVVLRLGGAPVQGAELRGVVVSAKTGEPVPDVTIAMVHAEEGHLYLGGPGDLQAYGPDDLETGGVLSLLFGTKRGWTAQVIHSDEAGRFTFSGFARPDEP